MVCSLLLAPGVMSLKTQVVFFFVEKKASFCMEDFAALASTLQFTLVNGNLLSYLRINIKGQTSQSATPKVSE